MRLRSLLLGLALVCAVPSAIRAATIDRDASAELRRLASTRSADREQAQRWLAVHLAPTDHPDVAAAARRGDAETRRRLVRALSSDDRHLELIVRLCDDTGEEARGLGRDALTALALAWLPGLDDAPLATEEVLGSHAETAADVYSLGSRVETLAERFERIARHTDLNMPLVVTPELLDLDGPRLRPALEGTALELLSATVLQGGLSFAGVGFGEADAGPAVLVVGRRGRAAAKSGFERLEEWCLDVRRGKAEARNASLALASTGWPAALLWLEGRAFTSPENASTEAALEGLLAAARQGLVVPGLTRAEARRALLERGDRLLAAGDEATRRRGEGLARALAELGPRTPGGEECGELLLERWEASSSDAEHWLRLVAMEGQRSRDARLITLAAGVAADANRKSGLRFQALRALAAVGGGPLEIDDARGLRRLRVHCAARGAERELLDLLGSVASPPGTALLEAAEADADPAASPFLARWALRAGDPAAAEGLLRAAGTDGMRTAANFERWAGVVRDARRVVGVRQARELVDGALAESAPELARHLTIRAGLTSQDEQRAWAEELNAREKLDVRALVSLAQLAAGPRSTTVRVRLVAELEGASPARARALASACAAATDVLRAARRDAELRLLQRAVWKAVRPPGHLLHDSLGPGEFPARVRLVARPLDAQVRTR